MPDPRVGDYILNYQKFKDDALDPDPPFVCLIIRDTSRVWYVEHLLKDGTTRRRRINKGCCSTRPLDPRTVDDRYKDLMKTKRVRLKEPAKRVRL